MADDARMWSKVFGDHYLRTYAHLLDPAIATAQAEALVRLVALEPGADVLDCPCGFGRHSIELARLGMHVVGADWSESQLEEAKRRAGEGEWPKWVQADYRDLPFDDASVDCVANLFSSLGYWGDDDDRRAIREFFRVLRPGGSLVIETMHRDRVMAIFDPRDWQELPDGGLLIEERQFDYVRGTTSVRHELVEPDGERRTAPYEMRVYTVTELVGFVREAGFERIDCYGGFDETPVSRDTRLVLVAS